jgi:Uma2 family endonuclease
MTALHEDALLVSQFETIAQIVEREAEGVHVEFIRGRMEVKPPPDGTHNGILNWLLLFFVPFMPKFFLHREQGLVVGTSRQGRARPDGVVASFTAFRDAGEWRSPDPVLMAVEVTSYEAEAARRDRVEKPVAYAESGIPIYLLIDRDEAEAVVYSVPEEGKYRDVHRCAIGRTLDLPDPIGLTLDTAPLLEWLD